MSNKIYAAFVLTDLPFEPELITSWTGIIPSKTWKKGDLRVKKGTIEQESNGWEVHSKASQFGDFEIQIRSILEQLQPGWLSLAAISSQCHAELSFAIYIYSEHPTPATHFSKEIVQKLAELNAAIDIYLYILTEGD